MGIENMAISTGTGCDQNPSVRQWKIIHLKKKSHRNLVGFPLLVLNIYDSYPAELHHFFRGLTTSCFTPWVRLKQSVRWSKLKKLSTWLGRNCIQRLSKQTETSEMHQTKTTPSIMIWLIRIFLTAMAVVIPMIDNGDRKPNFPFSIARNWKLPRSFFTPTFGFGVSFSLPLIKKNWAFRDYVRCSTSGGGAWDFLVVSVSWSFVGRTFEETWGTWT